MIRSLLAILFIVPLSLSAQKFDYVWITGDDNQLLDTTYGGSLIDFNFNPVKATYHYRELNMFTTNSSICDSLGNLLFYTNGCAIAGSDDIILENGGGINPGSSHTLWCDYYKDGYAGGPQNSIILPLTDSAKVYYLFHKRFIIYSNPSDVINDKLYLSIIDMNANSGKGRVLTKNLEILSDTLSRGEICAVKHANGKGWWLITPKRNSNNFFILKLNPGGIIDTFQQSVGILPDSLGEGLGQLVFSPDGSKLFRTCRYRPVMVYTFDREAGVFTQFDTIQFDYGNQLIGEIGCAVSPNNRYLYLACRKFIYQLDLWAADIGASQTTVAEWDGFADPFPTMFWQCQLGPDCKIYVMAGGDTRYYHVIHNPDEAGLACNVEQRGLVLPTPSGASMPSFPNYRLGPLDNPGVPCSPVVSTTAPKVLLPGFSVFPNPVSTTLNIAPNRQFNGQGRFRLFDVAGRLVHDVEIDPSLSLTEMDVREIPVGLYVYEIWCGGGKARSGKVVKVGN